MYVESVCRFIYQNVVVGELQNFSRMHHLISGPWIALLSAPIEKILFRQNLSWFDDDIFVQELLKQFRLVFLLRLLVYYSTTPSFFQQKLQNEATNNYDFFYFSFDDHLEPEKRPDILMIDATFAKISDFRVQNLCIVNQKIVRICGTTTS